MKTIVRGADNAGILQAAEIIRAGGLAAFPTETVYGLGASAWDEPAVNRIYEAKNRPADNPLILHISDRAQFFDYAESPPAYCGALVQAFWPGPLTLVAIKKISVPVWGTAGLNTVAVRVPSSKVARLLVEYSKTPIYAPSANASGRPSPTTAQHVLQDLDGKIDIVLDGGACALGLESTVLDVTSGTPRILRPGCLTAGMIYKETGIYPEAGHFEGGAPKAPGMKYRHYATIADLTVINGEPGRAAALISKLAAAENKRVGILATAQTIDKYDREKYIVLNIGDRSRPERIGASLFSKLREFDDMGAEIIYAEGVASDGVGEAVMNRLTKAAGGRVVDV